MDQNNQKNQPQDQDQPQATPKQQVTERMKSASNVLVTVNSNPSVDELAATIGLTLMLNKLGKHATAVFSGTVPSTLEFLKPEETIETNTDSLRDFIVSLDKSKADKLRYKVEENVVKIFITPYRASITQDDLEFTQGDFNVDAVLALGVTQREELDQAITQHGRILHDATVVTITAGQDFSELGQINWQEQGASSLSEMLVSISEALQGGLIDEQIATAFLTGIVSETERFSNTKTNPKVMTMAAQLMAAGANQQLIANELEKAVEVDMAAPEPAPLTEDQPAEAAPAPAAADDAGTLSIEHSDAEAPQGEAAGAGQPELQDDTLPPLADPSPATEPQPEQPAAPEPEKEAATDQPTDVPLAEAPKSVEDVDDEGNQIHIDVEGNMMRKAAMVPKHKVIQPLSSSESILSAASPSLAPADGASGASVLPPLEEVAPGPEPSLQPMPSTAFDTAPAAPEPPDADQPVETPPAPFAPPAAADAGSTQNAFPPAPGLDLTPSAPIPDNTTLQQLEAAVGSPHAEQGQDQTIPPTPDSARDAVASALNQAPFNPANNSRMDVGGLPLGAPPEQSSYDSFRLPDHSPASQTVTDVSGNIPGDITAPASMPVQPAPAFSLPGQAPVQQEEQMAPPPVPPPMTSL